MNYVLKFVKDEKSFNFESFFKNKLQNHLNPHL